MTERQPLQSVPRPRYGRLGAASSAAAITLVTLLGGLGLLPDGSSATASSGSPDEAASLSGATIPGALRSVSPKVAKSPPAPDPTPPTTPDTAPPDTAPPDTAPPAASGTGKRVVFDMSDQRVWLVDSSGDEDEVLSTYLVSGSVTDNLDPGTYEVYSHSRWAVGIDDSGVMEYFVRFTRGDNAAIGFHSIPTKNDRPLQRRAQLGTPQSHGCIRQALPEARTLWDFAPVGTKVVVTA